MWTISYETHNGGVFTASTVSGGSQSITGISKPGVGSTKGIYFSQFGLTINLNSAFDPSRAIGDRSTPNATPALTMGTEAAEATTFQYKVGTGGNSAEDDLKFTLKQSDTASLD